MPKCPKCKQQIDKLVCFSNERNMYFYNPDGYVGAPLETIHFELDCFRCPKCGEQITHIPDEALTFLNKSMDDPNIISLVPGYEVIITIEGGAVQGWTVPKGVRVVVKDYDTDGADFEGLKKDEDGEYQEIILEHEEESGENQGTAGYSQ
jgi:hypothetical protein